ncbi:MAG TPA: polysaccharide biosynthesis/export family protein, partial [Lacipirellulaceae bacterium]|nr:polysaccharide biosynthesis/export family protein [Lacipirellulaceae bacterium]
MRRLPLSGLLRPRFLMRSGSLIIAFLIVGTLALVSGQVDAQQNNNSLQQVLQQLPGAQNGGQDSSYDQTQQQQQPAVLLPDRYSPPLPTSRLEQIISGRAGATLKQFGYDQVGSGKSVRVPQTGAVQDNYILGPGDEVIVTFRGQENSEYRYTVDRSGQITLPRLSPILAAGQTLGEFRQAVQAAVRRGYVSTQAFVNIGQMRQVSVVVSGEVNNPGVRVVTGLSTPLDAILLSGGIKKTGSLRSIKLVHGGRTTIVDLYSVLLQSGRGGTYALSDGDRIIVPPLGKTVAVSGWVRRPGIYELSQFETALSARRVIDLAGGLEIRGKYRMSVIGMSRDGNNTMAPATEGTVVRDSDILIVQPAADQTENRATLSGATPLAGIYSVGKSTTLADVLRAPGALGTAPYTLFGAISRRDPRSQIRTLIPFTPVAVLNGSENMELNNHDIVRVFTLNESRLLTAVVSAFRNRRSNAEAALLTPEAVLQSLGTSQVSSTSNAAAAAAAAGSNSTSGSTSNTDQQGSMTDQQVLNATNGVLSDRQNIAELSTMVLGDGGV